MMTAQEVYDKVKKHLLTQGQKALGTDGSCRYRTDDGLKCAVGCLIDDAHYQAVFENRSPLHESVARALEASGVPETLLVFCDNLQNVHDRCPVDKWEGMLSRAALAQGLQP